MRFLKFQSCIAKHYLSALINGDQSGLSTADAIALNAWRKREEQNVKEDGLTPGHWTSSDDDSFDWRTCEVTGLKADCTDVTLHAYRAVKHA